MKPASAETEREAETDPSANAGQFETLTGDVDPAPSTRNTVTIKLAGKEYRLRSEASEEGLQRVASYVDHAMQKIKERTDTVDSQDIALLTALNLAREVLQLREQAGLVQEFVKADAGARLQDVIEKIEAVLPATESGRP